MRARTTLAACPGDRPGARSTLPRVAARTLASLLPGWALSVIWRRVVLGLLVVLTTGGAAGAAASVLLAAGEPSPLGLPFSSFPAVAIDDRGRAVVLGASNGVFHRDVQGLRRILVAGDVLPSGRVVVTVGAMTQDEAGCAIVRVGLLGGTASLLRRCGDRTDVLFDASEAAPGGGRIVDLVGPVAAAGPHVAFGALLEDGRTSVLRLTGTTLVQIVATGDIAPRGGAITSLRLVGVGADGMVGFRAAVSGGRDGFLRGDGQGLEAVVIVGDAVGGLGEGGTIGTLGGATLNPGNVWAFRAVLGTARASLPGVFRIDAAAAAPRIEPLALEGKEAGTSGVTFRRFAQSLVPSINASGVVAFRAGLAGGDTGAAVFTIAPGGPIVRVVGTREVTPVGPLVRFRDPVIADDGSLCIVASRSGVGPGLYVYRDGALRTVPLAQQGERTDVDTGQERFRFSSPSVRARAEDAFFLGSREGLFRVGSDRRVSTLAFVGGPTPLGGTYARLDAPGAGLGGVAFAAEIAGGRAGRAVLRVGRQGGGPRPIAASNERGPGGGRFVDFFAGALDVLERPALGIRDEVGFEANLQGGRFARGIFQKDRGPIRSIAVAGARAAGGGQYLAFGTPALMRPSVVAFVADIEAGNRTITALVLKRGRRSRRLLTTGDVVAGRLTGTVRSLDTPAGDARLVVWRTLLAEQAREAIVAHDLRQQTTAVLVGTGDPAPGGGVFRSVEQPLVSGNAIVFLGRVTGRGGAPGLYALPREGHPAEPAVPPAVVEVLGPGAVLDAQDTRVRGIVGFDANRTGQVVASVETTGPRGPAAVVTSPALP